METDLKVVDVVSLVVKCIFHARLSSVIFCRFFTWGCWCSPVVQRCCVWLSSDRDSLRSSPQEDPAADLHASQPVRMDGAVGCDEVYVTAGW